MIENLTLEQTNLIESIYTTNPELRERFEIIRPRGYPLTQGQQNDLLNLVEKMNFKHYSLIHTMLFSGIRVSEAVNLPIPKVNFLEQTIEISANMTTRYLIAWKPKTIKSSRIIRIREKSIRILEEVIGKRVFGYVFNSRKHTNKGRLSVQSVIDMVNAYALKCPRINRPIGSHCLRRTFASYLAYKQISIAEISKLLGHSSIKTTMLYLYDIRDLREQENVIQVLDLMNSH